MGEGEDGRQPHALHFARTLEEAAACRHSHRPDAGQADLLSCAHECAADLLAARRGKDLPYGMQIEMPLDENSAKWIPDQGVSQCCKCKKSFDFFNRFAGPLASLEESPGLSIRPQTHIFSAQAAPLLVLRP